MILITGATGFVGTNLRNKLTEKKIDFKYMSKEDCDLLSQDEVATLYHVVQPDTVIHLAGTVGGIGANKINPGKFFYENMLMGMNVIHQAKVHNQYSRWKIQKIILIGTVCSYPKFTKVPFIEKDLWLGYPEETNAPYGIAKRALIEMADAYYRQYGLLTICLLPVNMYGPHDSFDLETNHVIPALIKKFDDAKKEQKEHIVLWGSGKVSREFLYVEDCCQAILNAIEYGNRPQPINIGTGQEIFIKDLAELIKYKIGYEGQISWDQTKPDGQPRRRLDITKAWKELGFVSTTSLNDGLDKTIEWYKSCNT